MLDKCVECTNDWIMIDSPFDNWWYSCSWQTTLPKWEVPRNLPRTYVPWLSSVRGKPWNRDSSLPQEIQNLMTYIINVCRIVSRHRAKTGFPRISTILIFFVDLFWLVPFIPWSSFEVNMLVCSREERFGSPLECEHLIHKRSFPF